MTNNFDNMANSLCNDRMTCARALASMEEPRSAARRVVAARGGSLVERIARMLGRPEPVPAGRPAVLFVVLTVSLVFVGTWQWRPTLQAEDTPSAEQDEAATPSVATPPPRPEDSYPDLANVERELGAVPFQHEHPIDCIGWLDGGRSLLTASRHGLRTWDVKTQSLFREISTGVSNYVLASVSRDGRRIAVIDKVPRVIEWPSGREICRISGGMAVALSPDGTRVAVATIETGSHGNLKIFDAETGALLADRRGPPTWALSWSPDSKLLAVGEQRGIVIFLRDDGSLVRPGIRLEPVERPIAVAFNSTGDQLAIVAAGGMSGVWRMSDRKQIWSKPSQDPRTQWSQYHAYAGVVFADSDRKLFTLTAPGSLMAFDARTGDVLEDLSGHWPIGGMANPALSPDGALLAFVNERTGIDFVEVGAMKVVDHGRERHRTTALCLSPDRQTLLTIGDRNVVHLDARTLARRAIFEFDSSCSVSAVSPDDRQAAIARTGTRERHAVVDLVNIADGNVVRSLPLQDDVARGLVYLPDGRHLVVAELQHLSIWNVASGMQEKRLKVADEANWLERLAVSPNGERAAAILRFRNDWMPGKLVDASRGAILLFEVRGGEAAELLAPGTPTRIAFADDSTLVASMSRITHDNHPVPVLVEWDINSRELREDRLFSLPNTGPYWEALSIDPKRRLALAGCPSDSINSSSLALFDQDSRQLIHRFTLPGVIEDAALLPDNRVVFVKRNGNVLVLRMNAPPDDAQSPAPKAGQQRPRAQTGADDPASGRAETPDP